MTQKYNLIHCSYHKCLTRYYGRVMRKLYNKIMPWSGGYHHFSSYLDKFYRNLGRYKILSVNNHKLDFELLGDFRITRFIRDPRDLVVSGYFYHKRGAEKWSNIVGPKEEDWRFINMNIPKGMGKSHSYSSYLQSLSEEEGIIAEIEFRKYHFESMLQWPDNDSRIIIFRYEDILGNEVETFRRIFNFYEIPFLEREIGCFLARLYSAKWQSKLTDHIRNPEPRQWKRFFTPKVNDYFNKRYGELLIKYGYE